MTEPLTSPLRARSALSAGPTATPTLDELIAQPERSAEVTADDRRRLVRQLAALILTLESCPAAPELGHERAPASTSNDDRLLNAAEAATQMGFARGYVYELIRRHELRAVRRGKYVRIPQSAILEWAQAHRA